ncbi:MAG: hypothetical protein D6790_15850 [Caldilineae bacterium]|nr:MAG: hypothetical protein D6790_15850 [Caldilineae bacterium]
MTVRDYYSLTTQGRARRLRELAWNALAAYDLDVVRMQLLSNEWNGVFRLDTRDGRKLVLRVGLPRDKGGYDPEEIRSEMMWTDALHRELGLTVPAPIRNRDGDLLTTASAAGVPEPRHCVVFTWVPGVDLADRLTEAAYAATGELMARLHMHAATWTPPPGFHIVRNDTPYHPKDPQRLLTPPYLDRFTPEQQALLRDATARVEAVQGRLWNNGQPPRVIHHDLHMWNVKLDRGRVHPIDFEDLVWGHPVQDIGLALYYIQDRSDYTNLRRAFQEGYTRHLPWPDDDDIDAFIVRRSLDFLNHFVGSDDPQEQAFFPKFMERSMERMRRLMPVFSAHTERSRK